MMNLHLRPHLASILLVALSTRAFGLQPAPVTPFAATGTVEYAFTPGDRADDMIIAAIASARRQVLVQAFSLTHRRIGDALIQARARGIDVVVIADGQQVRSNDPAVMRAISKGGVSVLLDSHHAWAHNKTMVIDAGLKDCAVVTGSYNFTYAAQHRNAENVIVLRGNAALCEAFGNNWQRHRAHSLPYRR